MSDREEPGHQHRPQNTPASRWLGRGARVMKKGGAWVALKGLPGSPGSWTGPSALPPSQASPRPGLEQKKERERWMEQRL